MGGKDTADWYSETLNNQASHGEDFGCDRQAVNVSAAVAVVEISSLVHKKARGCQWLIFIYLCVAKIWLLRPQSRVESGRETASLVT